MIDLHHWSLKDIDETDIESLIPFFFHYPKWKGRRETGGTQTKKVFADQVEF